VKYLLDTHAWVWASASPRQLSRRVRGLLSRPGRYEELLLSAVSVWEFCKLIEKGRITVSCHPEEWIAESLGALALRLVPLSPRIAYCSTTLPSPFHDDPADQIIVATAREEGATIVTKDDRIRSYPQVRTVW